MAYFGIRDIFHRVVGGPRCARDNGVGLTIQIRGIVHSGKITVRRIRLEGKIIDEKDKEKVPKSGVGQSIRIDRRRTRETVDEGITSNVNTKIHGVDFRDIKRSFRAEEVL